MLLSETVKSAIHTIATVLETPAIIILILAVAIVVIELGSLIVEIIVERRHAKVDVRKLIAATRGKDRQEIAAILEGSSFLRSKKKAFAELLEDELTAAAAEALAGKLISREELRSGRILQITDIISRIAPMFGLMATLIPLGPGMIALGRGDTQMLSQSLLTAFDATVSGLAAAGIAYIISRVRKRWYEDDLVSMESVLEVVLAELYDPPAQDAVSK
jgi:biopolymer transport protein ExbB/TolQ